LLIVTFTIVGCGSAEAIKSYRYPTTKYNLEKAVKKVIKSNPHIYLDTIERKVRVRRNPNDRSDTTTVLINAEDYDGKEREEILALYAAYTKIKIKVGQTENVYVFQYYGNEQDWKSSQSSAIFISEVHDKYGNTLEQGHNEHGEFRTKRAKGFTELFEAEVINKLDKELNLKHTIE
jgi:hypothetical protein